MGRSVKRARVGRTRGSAGGRGGIRRVLQGTMEEFSLEYPCHSAREPRLVVFLCRAQAVVWLPEAAFALPGSASHEPLFNTTITDALAQVLGGRTDRTVRAFGTMASAFMKAGNLPAAIRFETLWNVLAATTRFSLLRAYVKEDGSAQAVSSVVEQQSPMRPTARELWLRHGSTCPLCGTEIPAP